MESVQATLDTERCCGGIMYVSQVTLRDLHLSQQPGADGAKRPSQPVGVNLLEIYNSRV
jgi:hypothetical protein